MGLPSRDPEVGTLRPPASRWRIVGSDYWYYWGGSVASWAGLAMADVLLLFLVFDQTHSAVPVAYIGIASAVPALAVALPAGALADRYDRRQLLWVTALLQAISFGAVPLTLWLVGFNLPLVFGLTVALESATAIFRPSANAVLPSLVEPRSLEIANGMLQAATSVAAAVGAALAAFLIVVVGLYPGFEATVVVFALSGALLLRLSRTKLAGTTGEVSPRRTSFLGEIGLGLQYVGARPGLLELTIVSIGLGFFVSMFTPFLVVYTVNVLGIVAGAFGFLLAGFSAGFVIGSLAVTWLPIVRRYGQVLVVGLCLAGLLVGVLVLIPSFPTAVAALTLMGGLFGILFTGFLVLVQRIVPPELQGRYFSIDDLASFVMTPVGIFFGGLVTVYVGIGITYGIVAIGLVGIGLATLAMKELRRLGWREEGARQIPPHVAGVLPGSIPSPARLGGGDPLAEPAEVRHEIRP